MGRPGRQVMHPYSARAGKKLQSFSDAGITSSHDKSNTPRAPRTRGRNNTRNAHFYKFLLAEKLKMFVESFGCRSLFHHDSK